MPRELLLILTGDPEGPPLAAVRHSEHVTQVASDRVFAIEDPGPERTAALRALPDVFVGVGDQPPAAVTAGLNERERLWIEAWSRRAEPKRRAGQGRPWDAPGFEPPDPN